MKGEEKKIDVLVVGELNMDLILNEIATFPEIDKEILAHDMTLTLGSSSAIFACNLSVLGTRVSFAGMVGEDQFGNQILSSLSDKKVEIGSIIKSKRFQSGLTVSLSFKNKKAAITYPGAMNKFSQENVSDDSIRLARHLHVSSIFMQPELKKGIIMLFKRAKEFGLSTSLDTQWDPEEKWDCDWKTLLPHVDVFLPNINEAMSITRQSDPENCIENLKGFSNTVVLKCGIEGSLAWDGNSFIRQSAFLNEHVKDAIGAGDSFNAGFIHRFLQGKNLKRCMEFAAVCGAVNTTEFGGTAAFSTKENIIKTAKEKFNYNIHDL